MYDINKKLQSIRSLSSRISIMLVISFILPQLLIAQDNIYKLAYQGDLDRYFYPLWSLDSKMFSVQVMSDVTTRGQKDLLSLFIYYESDNKWEGTRLFSQDKKKNSGPVINRPVSRNERSLCWPINKSASRNRHWAMVTGGEETVRSNSDKVNILQNWVTKQGEIKSTKYSSISGRNGLVHSYYIPSKAELFVTFNSQDRKVLNKIISIGSNTACIEVKSFHLPIRSITATENGQTIYLIIGSETIYEFWVSSDGGDSFSQLEISIDGYTIFTEIDINPKDPSIISFIASDNVQSEKELADLCIFNTNGGKEINKLEVFRHSQIYYSGQAYHQWSPSGNDLFFIRSNSDNNKQLFSWNYGTNSVSKISLPEIDIKTFKFSPDGKYLTVISNARNKNMRIYSISR
jgi:hypothetical protein